MGIKDIIDTADMPTENGFAGHKGRRPSKDAAAVARLRAAGAVIMGKTVTTECANRAAGKTRNPVNPGHTPGGSSSGSAAAVRARMVPAALGTQTGGSVIRPASYCGIHGFKPSFGLISRAGMLAQSDPLDTIGTYGRSIEDVAVLADALIGPDPADPDCKGVVEGPLATIAMEDPPEAPKLGFLRSPVWERGEARMHAAMEGFAKDLEEVTLPEGLEQAWEWHRICQFFGIARHYGPLADYYCDLMSPRLRMSVEIGRGISSAAYTDMVAKRADVNVALAALFERFDVIATPASPGPAPKGLGSTGEPVFNAFWTYAGVPCVTLPLLQVDGLPMGVQLVGPKGGDGALLRTARWLEGEAASRRLDVATVAR